MDTELVLNISTTQGSSQQHKMHIQSIRMSKTLKHTLCMRLKKNPVDMFVNSLQRSVHICFSHRRCDVYSTVKIASCDSFVSPKTTSALTLPQFEDILKKPITWLSIKIQPGTPQKMIRTLEYQYVQNTYYYKESSMLFQSFPPHKPSCVGLYCLDRKATYAGGEKKVPINIG